MNDVISIYSWKAEFVKKQGTNFLAMNTNILDFAPSDPNIQKRQREIERIGNARDSHFLFTFKYNKDEYVYPLFGKVISAKCKYENLGKLHHILRITFILSLKKEEFKKLERILLIYKPLPRWKRKVWDMKGVLIALEERRNEIREIANTYLMLEGEGFNEIRN